MLCYNLHSPGNPEMEPEGPRTTAGPASRCKNRQGQEAWLLPTTGRSEDRYPVPLFLLLPSDIVYRVSVDRKLFIGEQTEIQGGNRLGILPGLLADSTSPSGHRMKTGLTKRGILARLRRNLRTGHLQHMGTPREEIAGIVPDSRHRP